MSEATPQNLTLKVFGRTGLGKNAAFRTRHDQSMVPAVVYGPKLKASVAVNVSPKDIRQVYSKAGKTTLITIEAAEGAPSDLNGTKVLFKELQTHPLKNTLLHVDLHQLDLTRPIRVTVPLTFVGKSKGLAEGGIMSIITRQAEIKALPQAIPNHIDIDVSELGVNESIHIEDIAKKMEGGKFEFIYETNYVLVAVVPPEAEEVVTPTAAAAEGAAAAPGAEGAAAAGAAAPAAGAPAAAGGKAAAAPAAGGDKAKK